MCACAPVVQAGRRYAPPELGSSINESLRRSADLTDPLSYPSRSAYQRPSGSASGPPRTSFGSASAITASPSRWGNDSVRDLRESIDSLASLRLRGEALDTPEWDDYSGRLRLR